MAYTIIRPKEHSEWLQHRTGGIGSSEVGTILGLNPYETPLQLWRRKTGLDGAKEETFAMKAGHYFEDGVARFFQDATGYSVDFSTAGDWIAVDNDRPWLRVSPDRLYNDGACILECKTTQKDINADDIPPYWFAQLQYQLGVMGLKSGSLAWVISGREFGYKEIDFNQEFYDYMTNKVTEFWERNVKGGIEPSAINAADIAALYPSSTEGKVATCTADIMQIVPKLKELKEQKKQLEEQIASIEDKIKVQMGDAEVLLDPFGAKIATWKSSAGKPKFDEKEFKKNNPEMWDKYQKEGACIRRFLLK